MQSWRVGERGERIYFESMLNVGGVPPDMKHYGCIVDMPGRDGLPEEAEGIIRSMSMKPDVRRIVFVGFTEMSGVQTEYSVISLS